MGRRLHAASKRDAGKCRDSRFSDAERRRLSAHDRGEFRPWFRRHFALSYQSAAAYMKLARRMSGNVKPPDFRILSDVAYPHKKTPPWQQPVREEVRAVDVGALAAVYCAGFVSTASSTTARPKLARGVSANSRTREFATLSAIPVGRAIAHRKR